MIRSSSCTLKFANKGKRELIRSIISEYKHIMEMTIDRYWEQDKTPEYAEKSFLDEINTWLTARMKQCASRQALMIVKGTKEKQRKRKYMIKKFRSEGKIEEAKRLQKKYDDVNMSKPNLNNIRLRLDSRFIQFDFENDTIFDGILVISSIGNRMKLNLPFKRHRHFNRMMKKGKILKSVVLSENEVVFCFEIGEKQKDADAHGVIGIDIGANNVVSCSNGFQDIPDIHGHTMKSIMEKLSRRKKGSKGFKKAQEHRRNYINWTINQLNLSGVKEVRIEDIKHLRKGKRTNRFLSHFVYRDIFAKIESRCEEENVSLVRINPRFTSQRCSKCGWVKKANRKGKTFHCDKCGHLEDADINAAKNIALPLRELNPALLDNKSGFYWHVVDQEPVVPDAHKPIS